MAGVLSFDFGAMFIIRAFKSLGDPFNYRWSNSYEFLATAAGTLPDLLNAAGRVCTFEAKLHAEAVAIDTYSVSTWVADSMPYDPQSFVSGVPASNVGEREVEAMVGLDLTAFLRREPGSGRSGRLYLRGSLGERDVEREGAGWALTSPEEYQGELSDALSDSRLSDYFLGGSTNLTLSMISKETSGEDIIVRPIRSISVGGAAGLQLKRGWYNQPSRATAAQKAANALKAAPRQLVLFPESNAEVLRRVGDAERGRR